MLKQRRSNEDLLDQTYKTNFLKVKKFSRTINFCKCLWVVLFRQYLMLVTFPAVNHFWYQQIHQHCMCLCILPHKVFIHTLAVGWCLCTNQSQCRAVEVYKCDVACCASDSHDHCSVAVCKTYLLLHHCTFKIWSLRKFWDWHILKKWNMFAAQILCFQHLIHSILFICYIHGFIYSW